jgi:hypothetical protein
MPMTKFSFSAACALIVLASSANACPNLSGQYKGKLVSGDDEIRLITIVQNDCSSVSFEGNTALPLDGVPRRGLGGMLQLTGKSTDQELIEQIDTFELTIGAETTNVASVSKTPLSSAVYKFSLDQDRNLVTKASSYENGVETETSTTIAQRVK